MYPERLPAVDVAFDFSRLMSSEFNPLEEDRYPCFRFAKEALEAGGIYPLSFNTANGIVVNVFIKGPLGFTEIPRVIENCLETANYKLPDNVGDLIEIEMFLMKQTEGRIVAGI